AMETVRQRQQKHQSDAAAHRQWYINNSQLHKFILKFSEATDLPIESPGMYCSNGKMYIYDTQHELHHRTNAISNSNLNPAILEDIKAILDEVNFYSINFRYISNFPEEDIKNLSMLIHTNIPELDQRTHNVPTAPQVAEIWINNDVPP
ncbi:10286_t:CDS:2, partial [Acaulospora morrowiae]